MDTIEADYIVVGAGSAGCVVAARLSEDPSCRVVVLEAGGEDTSPWIHIPLGYGKTIADPRVNWCYETEADPGVNGRKIFWPRGKVLGGSSSINGLLYVRGQAEDFDHWRQLGNVGWSFDDVLAYFKRSEGRLGAGDELRGRGGPLAVSDLGERDNELNEAYIKAAEEVGIPRNPDYNGRVQEGVGYFQVTARNGRRCSAAVAFLRPAMKRANLRVITRALAERVLFAGKRAVGVSFTRDGDRTTVRATREVILCGGAVNSPQLLMLSGVGPAEHLQATGVEVTYDLPGVGGNLQDHFQTRFVYKCRFPITVNDIMMSKVKMARMGLQYLLFRSGPLTVSAGTVGIFTRTRPELASPDIQFHFIGFSSDRPAEGLHKFSGFSQNVCQLRPESRGEILLKSPDPTVAPAIHPNYLATELDRWTLVEGLKLGRRIAERPVMQHYIESEYLPGADVTTDDELLEYAKQFGGTIYHPCGTCKMGPDPMAVVDDQLRVHGLTGLRVADASIMPTMVSGNTNAACIMIGERCADFVRGQAMARAAA
ncbi:GMC family oxidoreductase [Limobrevibacterium gyesilva]|uniref:Choline dehydrogenase n=1 Tax=Limobrevibacterium gyesilva TaxID=2991712 RepID=A0AA42CHZ2_9PROT|nr:choline dehydrogenase [Limobrevibacterium gyesilva]MCW3475370.1 choline dehydrogenase [Limobrevibacterium gyesilva]